MIKKIMGISFHLKKAIELANARENLEGIRIVSMSYPSLFKLLRESNIEELVIIRHIKGKKKHGN